MGWSLSVQHLGAEFIIHEESVASTGVMVDSFGGEPHCCYLCQLGNHFPLFAPLATALAQAFGPGPLELPKGSQSCSQSDSRSTGRPVPEVPSCGPAALVGSLSGSEIFSGSLLLGTLN